jgi:hypothetical protein
MFTRAYLVKTLESVLVTFAAVFGASPIFTNGSLTVRGVEEAAIGAGIAAAYTFVKAFGGAQAIAASKDTK